MRKQDPTECASYSAVNRIDSDLQHELRDDAVEEGALVVKWLAALADTLLASAA